MLRFSRVLCAFVTMGALAVGAASQASAASSLRTQATALLHSHTPSGSFGSAVEIAGTAGLNAGGNDEVDDISCPSPGNCGAGGFYTDGAGHQQVWVANEVAGTWDSAVEIPGMALLNAGTVSDFNGISCPSAGNCTAVGDYTDESGELQAFVAGETGGTWGSAIEAPGTGFLNSDGVALALGVSCSSAGNCTAGGAFADSSAHLQAFSINEVNGVWDTAVQLPGVSTLSTGTNSALSWIDCSSSGNCSGVGIYSDPSSHTQSFVDSEVNGSWNMAQETPGDATLNGGGDMEFNEISCSSVGNCAAGGYYTDTAAHLQAFTISEVGGAWGTAAELPGISTMNAGGASSVFGVSCTAPGSCSAVGNYTDASSNQQAFVVDEVGGTWGSIEEAPGTDALNVAGDANLNEVSCTSPGNCDAGGYYSDTANSSQALVIDEVNGTWGSGQEAPGTAQLNAQGTATVLTTSCSTFGNCTAGGFYLDSAGNSQAFAITETFTKTKEQIIVKVTQTTKVIKKKVTETGLKLSAIGLGPATGSVVFLSPKGTLCTAAIKSGTATCSSSKRFPKGSLTVTAKYAGDMYDQTSTGMSRITVK
jgi:hypothetical protein